MSGFADALARSILEYEPPSWEVPREIVMTANGPALCDVPYLVFGGSQVWLVYATNEREAGQRFRADWEGRRKGVLAIAPNEIRIRPLRLEDEAWLRSSFEGPSNRGAEFFTALDKLRDAVR